LEEIVPECYTAALREIPVIVPTKKIGARDTPLQGAKWDILRGKRGSWFGHAP